MLYNCVYKGGCQRGFTLIETVVGIVVLSISFAILTNLLYPLATQSGDQLHQIRAAELGQSLLNEIQARAFDENSDKAGGRIRCGDTGASNCTAEGLMGADGETRATFDDVDDYDTNGAQLEALTLLNSLGTAIGSDLYLGYKVEIKVCNDSNYDGICFAIDSVGDIQTAKLITIIVTTPLNVDISFSTYRANF